MAIAISTVVLLNVAADAWHVPSGKAWAVGRAAAPPDNSVLKLRARTSTEQMEISWDHNSPAIRRAERGKLQIVDGDLTESVPFDPTQLQDGVLVYRPHSNDVSVRMEVNERDGQKISESVRAVRTP